MERQMNTLSPPTTTQNPKRSSLALSEYLVIPGAIVYFCILQGMIAFSLMVDQRFTAISGKPCKTPWVNTQKAISEMTRALAQRFPSGRDRTPQSIHLELLKTPGAA
jgi:hypothetical protein